MMSTNTPLMRISRFWGQFAKRSREMILRHVQLQCNQALSNREDRAPADLSANCAGPVAEAVTIRGFSAGRAASPNGHLPVTIPPRAWRLAAFPAKAYVR